MNRKNGNPHHSSTTRNTTLPFQTYMLPDRVSANLQMPMTASNDRKTKGSRCVFVCYHSADAKDVEKIAKRLIKRGLSPWLDKWALPPGLPWQKALERQLKKTKVAAVFIGGSGIGPWQDEEQAALLRQLVKRHCRVIPVILHNCINPPDLPLMLEGLTWVDFREKDPDPLEQLIWGITGKRNSRFA